VDPEAANRKRMSTIANRKICGGCLFIVLLIVVIGIFTTTDTRSGDALIEKPMIKIFNTFPTDGTVHKALNWQAKNPFPLRELVSNGTI
jgi:hypothetical protein